jgi:hypothetical protein
MTKTTPNEGGPPGSQPALSASKTVYFGSTGTYCRTKPRRESPSAILTCLATVFLLELDPHTAITAYRSEKS